MERLIQVHVEKLSEGMYLVTSDEIQGLVAQGRTVNDTLEIARDVARRLLDAQAERKGMPKLKPVERSFDLQPRETPKARFALWERLKEERARDRERDRLTLLTKVMEALDRLSRDYKWREAYVFGSLTRPGRFRAESDVDIAVRGLDKFALFAFVGDLSSLLGRDVDVVVLEECPFAETIVSKGFKWQKRET